MSSKLKSFYICGGCGFQSAKWIGKCPGCGAWNSFVEEVVETKPGRKKTSAQAGEVKRLEEVAVSGVSRMKSGMAEFDRLMGGGAVPGSVILMSGEPGIGKSTLLLQLSLCFARESRTLYVSGEESAEQIRLRADRLGLSGTNLFVQNETDVLLIRETVLKLKPAVVIIDSIQTMTSGRIESLAGSITQIRESAELLLRTAKEEKAVMFLVGHITKEGAIAGPKLLEHMVDVVLYLEGDRNLEYRLLRSHKNRHGSTFELAVFEMTSRGMTEVTNPSSYFISRPENALPGSAIVSVMEGSRPLLIEVQALVASSSMPYPRRVSEGTDYNKILLIAAILEKILGVPLNGQEVFVKVVGGLRIQEPAVDLGIACAILSSFKNIPPAPSSVFLGEIGLTGEIRPVPYMEQRLTEISKLGFQSAVLPAANARSLSRAFDSLKIRQVRSITDLHDFFPHKKEAVNV